MMLYYVTFADQNKILMFCYVNTHLWRHKNDDIINKFYLHDL